MTAANMVDLKQIRISPLQNKECLRRFKCGERDIDNWLEGKAAKWENQNRVRVFVAHTADNPSAKGFYSLNFSQEHSSKLSNHQHRQIWTTGVPLVYLHFLAVQRPLQGNGLGQHLLMDCLRRSYHVFHHVPFYGIGLRSLNERTTKLYQRYGFAIAEEEDKMPLMILPIWTLRDLFEGK